MVTEKKTRIPASNKVTGLNSSDGPVDVVDKQRARSASLVEGLGLKVPSAPTFDLEHPGNISSLSTADLEEQHCQWSAALGYAKWQASILATSAKLAESEYEKEIDARFTAYSRGETAANKAKWTGANKSVRRKKDVFIRLQADARMLSSLVYHYEKIEFSLSRALSRRQ